MTLFGQTLGGEQIASLVFMTMALVVWIAALRGERRQFHWLRQWEADRKARREAEAAAEGRGPPRGPWG